MANTNTLRTQYVNDLVKQRDLLEEALVYQNIDVNKNEGMNTMVSKVNDITGSKPFIPYINFEGGAGLTDDELVNILETINISALPSLKNILQSQKKLTKIDFSKVHINPNTPVYGMFNGCELVREILFSDYNDLTGIDNLGYICDLETSKWSGSEEVTPIDLSSFKLDETKPLSVRRAFAYVGKLPNNLKKCKFYTTSAFAKVRLYDQVLDLRDYNLMLDPDRTHYLGYNMFEGAFIKELIIDLSFDNVEGLGKDEPYDLYCFCHLSIGIKKYTFVNKHLCRADSLGDAFECRGLTHPMDLSGLNLSYTKSLSGMLDSYAPSELYLNDIDTSHIENFMGIVSGTSAMGLKFVYGDLSGASAIKVGNLFQDNSVEFFTGLIDVGKAYTAKESNYSNYIYSLSEHKHLKRECLQSIVNRLYDLNITYNVYDENGNPGDGVLYTQKLNLGAKNIAKLRPEEIAIATSKGWTVT